MVRQNGFDAQLDQQTSTVLYWVQALAACELVRRSHPENSYHLAQEHQNPPEQQTSPHNWCTGN